MAGFALLARQPPYREPEAFYTVPEAYEVYAEVLAKPPDSRIDNSRTLLIRSDSVPWEMCLFPNQESRKQIGSAINDYVSTNKKAWAFTRRFEIENAYELLDFKKDIWPFFENRPTGWQEFDAAHPSSRGWYELSAVGFNEDKTIAVVYISNHCGWTCGRGEFRVLQKQEGRWKDLPWHGNTCSWVS